MEVEIISKECIVPSSPTPPHLKSYKLSFLDQYSPSIYFPVIFFYPNNTNLAKGSELLKSSLSETLSRFYPLAGKVKDNLSIDCNDQGVFYVEAKANISLFQYLKQLDLASMHKLMLCRNLLMTEAASVSYFVMIQRTSFLCGGFAICLFVCHLFCDGTSMASFIKDWAATSSSNSSKQIQILHPFLNASYLFPRNTPFPEEASPISTLFESLIKKGKYKVQRFVFSSSSIARLKTKVTSSSSLMNASRVEVVSAILSKSLMAAFENKMGIDKSLGVLHNVNLRKRAVPPLPDCSLGNYIQFAGAVFKENDLSSLVSELREGIQKIDSDFVKNIQNEDGFFKFCEKIKDLEDLFSNGGSMERVVFSSWCNFGLYGIDFGWGKPLWATCFLASENSEMDETTQPNLNTIMLLDSRNENGVEAWVYIDKDDIVFLENDKELLQYATINPSPLESLANY